MAEQGCSVPGGGEAERRGRVRESSVLQVTPPGPHPRLGPPSNSTFSSERSSLLIPSPCHESHNLVKLTIKLSHHISLISMYY